MPSVPPTDPAQLTEIYTERPLSPVRYRPAVELRWTDARGSRDEIIHGRTTLGTLGSLVVVIADPSVSRVHVEIEPREDGVHLRDLGSTNGTWFHDARVRDVMLVDDAIIRIGRVRLEIRRLREPATETLWQESEFGGLVGRSESMRALFQRLSLISRGHSTVHIHGETGTGKELVAEAIHEHSPRRGGPFQIVDCAALSAELLESELFGHARGAFTGAVRDREGMFEAADGGTLFLDEIGELPSAMQPKLLRTLESRTVRRVGETTQRKIDVRVISATHRDLRREVNAGTFREDLYFRIAVVPVHVPALRERPEDLALLVRHFLRLLGSALDVTPAILERLAALPWKGNVRELRNVIDRVAGLGWIEGLAADAERDLIRLSPSLVAPPGDPSGANAAVVPYRVAKDAWNDEKIRDYFSDLRRHFGEDIDTAAAAADIDGSWLRKMYKRLGV